MRIIPVIDLLHSQVVRGVAGRRSEYRPVESVLCQPTTPRAVAAALYGQLQLQSVYIADLDAIQGRQPNWSAFREIADAGLELLIDAGLQDVPQTKQLLNFLERWKRAGAGQGGVVAGLETVHSPEVLRSMLDTAGPQRLIFSLDLKAGRPLTTSPAWMEMQPEQILAAALELGVTRFILLDLSRVGVGSGVGTESLCQFLRSHAPQVEIIAGGGVRGSEDLRQLSACGCDGVLVASALHDGRLDRAALDEFRIAQS